MSNFHIKKINPVIDPKWKIFVSKHPEAGIFHQPEWLELLQKQYAFKCFALCIEKENEISDGIPFFEVRTILFQKKWICLPFSDHCSPLFSSEENKILLLGEIIKQADKNKIHVEIRSSIANFAAFISHSNNWVHIKKIGTETELNTKSQRLTRALNKAAKNNLTSEIRTDKEAVSVFYGLHVATRKKLGVPVQSKKYFDKLYQNIISKNLGFVLLVKKDGQFISAGVFCMFKETLTFKYGASDPKALQFNPNHMMLWEAMVYGHKQGYKYFDFGKTSFSTPGLEVFKMEFKPEEYNLVYSYFPARPESGLFGKLEKYLVAPVIKNSPAFVCRLAGELLYKYFAV